MSSEATGPRISLSRNVMGLTRSPTLAIHAKSRRLAEAGRHVYLFGLGQSPFPVPDPVVDALRANAFRKDYLPVEGLPELRASVSDYLRRRRNATFSEAAIVVAPGSKELLFLIQLAFGGTGTSYPAARLNAITTVARRHGLIVVSDEIYAELSFDDDHVSIATRYPEGTVLLTGLSKWCGAGGWRLGVAAFPHEARALGVAVAAAASETFTSTSAPIQHAAVRAFRGGADIEHYLTRARRILRALAIHVASRLREAGLSVPEPQGAFYLFPDAGPIRAHLSVRGLDTAAALAAALLDEAGVASLPGSDFGRAADELTFRISLVDFDGARALEAAVDGTIDLDFLRERCAPVIEGADVIASWVPRH